MGRIEISQNNSIGTAPEISALYSRARCYSKCSPLRKAWEESIALFEQAVAKDRSFAPGYAGIAAEEAARSAF